MAETATLVRPAPRRWADGMRRPVGAASRAESSVRAIARGGTLLLGATLLWNISNFAFNAFGARALGPAGYGQLTAVVALLAIVSPLLYTLQATASGTTARLVSAGRSGEVRSQVKSQVLRALIWASVGAGVVVLGARPIAHLLRLSSVAPVLLLLAAVPLAVVINVQRGAMQGVGQFGRCAVSTATEAVANACAGALLLLVPNVEVAVLATAAALGCAAIAHTRLLRALPAAASTGATDVNRRGGSVTLACLVALAALLSADVIAARHGMGSHAAGMYAAIALAGKMVFYATAGLTWVLFPMLSGRDERGEDGRRLLLGAVGGVALVAAAIAGVEWLAPSLVIGTLAGHAYTAGAPWLAPAACAFAPYAVAYVLAMGLAARRRRSAAVVLAVACVTQISAFMLVEPSVGHLLLINASVFSGASIALAVICLREPRR